MIAGVWWALVLGVPGLAIFAVLGWQLVQIQPSHLAMVMRTQSSVLVDTGVYGLSTAVLATGLAWVMAHVQHCYRFVGRRLLHWLGLVALIMPSFTFAMGLVILFGHNGLVAQVFGFSVEIYGLTGLVIAGTLARLPYAYVVIRAFYRTLDPTLFQAADQLGASSLEVMRAVVWPRLKGVLFTVALLVFAETVADLANPVVIGGNHRVAASRLYEAVTGDGDLVGGSVYAILLVAPGVVYLLIARRIEERGIASVIARSTSGLSRRLSVVGWPLVSVAWLTGGLIAVLVGAVAAASFRTPEGLSAANYLTLLGGQHHLALAWSVLLVVIVVPLSVVLAWIGVMLVGPERRWMLRLERLSRGAAAMPPLVLGFAAYVGLVAARGHSFSSIGAQTALHFGLIVGVLILRSLPSNALVLLGEARTLTPDLRGAAMSLGAVGLQLVRLVYVPRLRDPIRGAVVLSVARTLTATSSVILLSDMLVPLATARMLIDVGSAQYGTAAAMAMVISGMIAILTLPVRRR